MDKYRDYFRRVTAQKALDAIWNVQTAHENENEIQDVIIFPPNDGNCSDQESGDEETANPDHLSRRQLTAPAELVEVGSDEQEDSENVKKMWKKYNASGFKVRE